MVQLPSILGRSSTTLGLFLTVAGAVLLGFVTFSVPYFSKVWLYRMQGPEGELRTGALGYMMNNMKSGHHVGYLPDQPYYAHGILKIITRVYVVFPIAFALALLAVLLGLAGLFLPVVMNSVALLATTLASALACAGFIVVIVNYFYARHHFNNVDHHVHLGKGFWFAVAATAALLFASWFMGLGVCCGAMRRRKQRTAETSYNGLYTPSMGNERVEEPIVMDSVHNDVVPVPTAYEEPVATYAEPRASASEPYRYPVERETVTESTVIPMEDTTRATDLSYTRSQQRSPVVVPASTNEWQTTTNQPRRSFGHSAEGGSVYEDAGAAASESHAGVAPALAYQTGAKIGAYDAAPALPGNLLGTRGQTSSTNNTSDAWFLPNSSESRTTGLPNYKGTSSEYPTEKGRSVL